MFRLMPLLLLAAWPPALPAADLHKCVDAQERVSYQSHPCAAGARTLWVRPTLPEAVPARPAASPATVAAAGPGAGTSPAPVRRAASAPRKDAVTGRCAAARRSADATRDRLWNRLSFKQRSDLDAKVARACAR